MLTLKYRALSYAGSIAMNISLASKSWISVEIPCLCDMYAQSEAPSSVLSPRTLRSISNMRRNEWVCVVVSPR